MAEVADTGDEGTARDPGLARERTELAWNRSGLAVAVAVAIIVRRLWPLTSDRAVLVLLLVNRRDFQASSDWSSLRSALIALGVGAVGMVVNFSTLVLVVAAVHEITHSGASSTARVVAFAALYVIVLLPVWLPVSLATDLGARADGILDATSVWIGRHARTIGIAVEAVFAVYLVVKGVRSLP